MIKRREIEPGQVYQGAVNAQFVVVALMPSNRHSEKIWMILWLDDTLPLVARCPESIINLMELAK